MSPTYTRKKNRHYPYYISQAVLQYKEDEAGSVIRIPGKTLEATVTDLLLNYLNSPDQLLDLLSGITLGGKGAGSGSTDRRKTGQGLAKL